jgi:putative ABC transport system permease protein
VRTLIGNLHYAFRVLRKNRGLTVAVIATLMLGIGVTTAIYTVVYAIIITPLPYPHPEQLVIVWSRVHSGRNGISAGDFLDWKQQSKSFQQLAAWNDRELNIATQDQPEQALRTE